MGEALGRDGPEALSDDARRVWDQMRNGRIQNTVALFDAAKRGQVRWADFNKSEIKGPNPYTGM